MSALTYGSVCSGIEAASVAWAPLGWEAAFVSEIEAAPRAVLQHRFPEVPLHGDFTTIQAGDYRPIQLLVGGTPCQSFSVAGLRGGLADDRGNLALQFLRLADRLRPRWLVWENVPGVLSSNGGRDFGAILGGMVELRYGFAYRVLDAQYIRVDGYGRAVPQRRRRVFVVGYLGDWRRPAAVLFERASLRGDPAPRRGARAGVAAGVADGPGGGCLGSRRAEAGRPAAQAFGGGQNCNPTDVSTALTGHPGGRYDLQNDTFIAEPVAQTLRARDGAKGVDSDCTDTILAVASTLVSGGHSNNPLDENLLAFDTTQITSRENRANPQPGDPCHPLSAGAHPPAIAFNSRQNPDVTWDRSGSLSSSSPQAEAIAFIGHNGGPSWAVRRPTPTECERLQGFPDGWTAVPWRGGIMPDGPRYKMLGNSMAVNCMRWIGRRIEAVDALAADPKVAA